MNDPKKINNLTDNSIDNLTDVSNNNATSNIDNLENNLSIVKTNKIFIKVL